MLRLRKKGKSNAAIAREVKLPNPSLDSGLVVPIIKFLLMDEANDVLESYKNHGSKTSNERTKICLVCGSEFVHCYLGMFVDRYVCLHCNYEWR